MFDGPDDPKRLTTRHRVISKPDLSYAVSAEFAPSIFRKGRKGKEPEVRTVVLNDLLNGATKKTSKVLFDSTAATNTPLAPFDARLKTSFGLVP